MLVAVTGTHSTGKTSFLRSVRHHLKLYGYECEAVEGVARRAREIGLPILDKHTFESTLWIIAETIRLEERALCRASVVLVDRPVHDAVAYFRAAVKAQGEYESSSVKDNILMQLVSERSAVYDFLFHTKLNSETPLGPGRDTNLPFRESVADEVMNLVAELEKGSTLVADDTQFAEKQAGSIHEALRERS